MFQLPRAARDRAGTGEITGTKGSSNEKEQEEIQK